MSNEKLMNPVGDYVLVKPVERVKEIGGLIIPSTVKDGMPLEGEVVSVGQDVAKKAKGAKKKPCIKVGSRILYAKYLPMEVRADKVKMHLLHEPEILGVLVKRPENPSPVPHLWYGFDLQVLGNRIFIDWQEAKSAFKVGGQELARADNHRAAHYTGVILALGPDVNLESYPVKVGERVLFDRFTGDMDPFDYQEKRYAWIRDYNVMCQIPHELAEKVAVGSSTEFQELAKW